MRHTLARLAINASLKALVASALILPKGHPARVYIEGQVAVMKQPLLCACRPYAFVSGLICPRTKRAMKALGGLAFLDSFAASPINLIGPNLHLFTRLGLPDLAAKYGHHILTFTLPW